MNRRTFIRSSLVASGTLGFLNIPFTFSQGDSNFKRRLGLTTVVFKKRFSQTAGEELNDELSLNLVPRYFAERFGIHNVEMWSKHFESKDKKYVKNLKKELDKSDSRLIDIQVDSSFDLSDTDSEQRKKAIVDMVEWIDTAAILESKYVRISSMRKSYPQAVLSIKELNKYAKQKGVKLLIENHFDQFSDTENHIKAIREINDDNVGLLADFSNFFPGADQFKSLRLMAPHANLVSAKSSGFNADCQHISFDYTTCIRIFEDAGYQGIYSLEQWGSPNETCDGERATDWMISEFENVLRS